MSEETKYKLQELESLTKVLARSLESSGEKIDARDVANVMGIIHGKISEILKE